MEDKKFVDLEWYPIGRLLSKEKVDINVTLRKIPLFKDVKERHWKDLKQLFHERKYETGEMIFDAGVPGLGMYIVLEGTVKILHRSDGNELEVASFTSGDFFGEMSLVEETVRSATAIATSPTVLIGLFRPQLLDLMRKRPGFGLSLMEKISKLLAARLRHANHKLAEIRLSNTNTEST